MSTEMTKKEPDAPATQTVPTVSPAVDVFENRDEYMLVADVPGIQRDDLELRLDRGELTIRGARSGGEGRPPALEYRRVFRVPDTLAEDGMSAELKGGVLTLHLPKAEDVKPRRIQIKSA